MKNIKVYILLHLMLMVYSTTGIFTKLASGEEFLSFRFLLFYGIVIGLLGIYAVCWQQVIKRIPLTTAYANRAFTLVWGLLWGPLFFGEKITAGKLVGTFCVLAGILLYVTADHEEPDAPDEKDVEAAKGGASHA